LKIRKIQNRTEASLQERNLLTSTKPSKKKKKQPEMLSIIRPSASVTAVKKTQDVKLSDFIKLDPTIHQYEKLRLALNDALIINLQTRLYRETFYCIERTILQQKMQKMQQASTVLQVHCVRCTSKWATTYCLDCLDHLCDGCIERIHAVRSVFRGHRTTKLDLNPQ
jgi:hypothetical protein